jgi:superfamily I DNA and/or RNA helicase
MVLSTVQLRSAVSAANGAGAEAARRSLQVALIDEAGQVEEAEGALVALRQGLQVLFLVGDHKQLPATVFSNLAQANG